MWKEYGGEKMRGRGRKRGRQLNFNEEDFGIGKFYMLTVISNLILRKITVHHVCTILHNMVIDQFL